MMNLTTGHHIQKITGEKTLCEIAKTYSLNLNKEFREGFCGYHPPSRIKKANRTTSLHVNRMSCMFEFCTHASFCFVICFCNFAGQSCQQVAIFWLPSTKSLWPSHSICDARWYVFAQLLS